jgi:sugar phosphate isomerase/epimerase
MDFNYQLYSSRNFPPLRGTLRMLKAAGYAGVEGYSAMYPDEPTAAQIAEEVAAAGLVMPSGHFALAEIEADPARVMRMARRMGMTTIVCPWLPPPDRPTDAAGWRSFGARLAEAGRPLQAEGFGWGWHNHDFEFRPLVTGELPHDLMMTAAPDMGWEIDVAWIVRGGADPLHYIARDGARILTAHVKDIAPAGEKADEDGWADVGTGTVPWAAAFAALKATGCAHYIMEHDNPSDHARFAAVSLQNARGLAA